MLSIEEVKQNLINCDIKLVSYSSTITMMLGPIYIKLSRVSTHLNPSPYCSWTYSSTKSARFNTIPEHSDAFSHFLAYPTVKGGGNGCSWMVANASARVLSRQTFYNRGNIGQVHQCGLGWRSKIMIPYWSKWSILNSVMTFHLVFYDLRNLTYWSPFVRIGR